MTADDPRARLRSAYDDFVADPKRMRLFQQEAAILAMAELLAETMNKHGVTVDQLARRLNADVRKIYRLVDGNVDYPIGLYADAFAVLGYRLNFNCEPLAPPSDCERANSPHLP